MSDVEMRPKWRNPLFLWGAKGAIEELPTIPFRSHQEIWRKTRESKTELFPVGRLRYYYKWPGHGSATWNRLRYWPTRRRGLRVRGEYNPKTLRRELGSGATDARRGARDENGLLAVMLVRHGDLLDVRSRQATCRGDNNCGCARYAQFAAMRTHSR